MLTTKHKQIHVTISNNMRLNLVPTLQAEESWLMKIDETLQNNAIFIVFPQL